jgi:hypothetical protein
MVEAKEEQKAGNSWMSWVITADYDLGGTNMKRAELNIRSVKSGKICLWYEDLEACQILMGGNVAFREWAICAVD